MAHRKDKLFQKKIAKTQSPKKPPLSPEKKRLFTLLMILVPFTVLFLLELGLTLFNYGGDWDLVLTQEIQGQKFYHINRQVAKKYFLSDDIFVPEATGDVFAYKKSPKTVRIFCLGESTTAGWPFQFNPTFPSQLHERLSLLFPNRDFEVINVGISAISSYSVLDFAHELVEYEPDLFILYLGHNEFYGALGAASTQSLGSNRAIIKLYLRLDKLRLFQLLRDGIALVRSKPTSSSVPHTLMEKMVADKTVLIDSPIYQTAKTNFTANLHDILETIKKSGTPVLVGTLVSNLADQTPFESVFPPGFRAQKQWQLLCDRGDQVASQGNYIAAIQAYMGAYNMTDVPAILSFKLGKCYQAIGRFDQAATFFQHARDMDALRFRAPGEFNDIIHRLCAEQKVPVVEIEKAFIDESPNGLVGNNLILEHVHPNVDGYFLMADAFCRAMSKNNILQKESDWPWQRDLPRAELVRQAYITELDLEMASQRIQMLTSRYPFKQARRLAVTDDPDYARVLANMVQGIFRKQIPWNEAHYRTADYLGQKKKFAEAEREYRAVIRVMPGNFYPYLFLANTLIEQNKMTEAEEALLQAKKLSAKLPFAYAKLGVLYMSRNESQKAKPNLEMAIALAASTPDFTQKDLAHVHYLYAVALAQLDNLTKAKQEAEISLRLLPGEERVKKLMAQIDSAATVK